MTRPFCTFLLFLLSAVLVAMGQEQPAPSQSEPQQLQQAQQRQEPRLRRHRKVLNILESSEQERNNFLTKLWESEGAIPAKQQQIKEPHSRFAEESIFYALGVNLSMSMSLSLSMSMSMSMSY